MPIEHTDDDVDEARIIAMLEHPHAAHAIAALSDDDVDDIADEHEAESAGTDGPDDDEFAPPGEERL